MSRQTVLALVLIALVIGLLMWLNRAGNEPAPPSPRSPTATASHAAAAIEATPPPYRLAGVAASGDDSYAVVADPDGATTLYRLGEEIAGLGRLAGIEAREVLIDTDHGPVTLPLQPAASPTPGPSATRRLPTVAATRAPERSPSPDDNASESPPSDAPDRPVS